MSVPRFEPAHISMTETIGGLDRKLSEFLYLANNEYLDEVDAQTLKHHADDLIGVGTKALEILEERKNATIS